MRDPLDPMPAAIEREDLFDFDFLDRMAALGWRPVDLPGSDLIGWRRAVEDPGRTDGTLDADEDFPPATFEGEDDA
jgi:hypothetical protein